MRFRSFTVLIIVCLLAAGAVIAQQPISPKTNLAGLNRDGLRTVAMELLRTYSPSGKFIIDRCAKTPSSFTIGNTTVRINANPDCITWVKGRTVHGLIADLPTAVHEMLHDYQLRIACAMLAEQKARQKMEHYAIYTGDETILVKKSKIFRTSEMQGMFPAEVQTTRFPVYVFPGKNNSAQTDGIYGLFAEFNAYYMSMKTAMDFLPYYEQLPPTPDNWFYFLNNVHRQYYAHAEFKLYILNYLRYARAHHPEVYAGIMKNREFIRAFLVLDGKYAQSIEDYLSAKQRIFTCLREAGYIVEEDDEFVRIIEQDGSYTGRSNFLRTYNSLSAELAKPAYVEMMAAMR